jgi:hypothetical protein
MVLVTHSEQRTNHSALHGVLLDAITPGDYRRDVFYTFLISEKAQEIVCENPRWHGSTAHTRDGTPISGFDSQLVGECEFLGERLPMATILKNVVENRLQLITTNNLAGVVFPAFLSTHHIEPPVTASVIVDMHFLEINRSPDFQAFVVSESYLVNTPEFHGVISSGMILPVVAESGGRTFYSALKLGRQIDPVRFEALLFHAANEVTPGSGATLSRKVTRSYPKKPPGLFEFSEKIATIVHSRA